MFVLSVQNFDSGELDCYYFKTKYQTLKQFNTFYEKCKKEYNKVKKDFQGFEVYGKDGKKQIDIGWNTIKSLLWDDSPDELIQSNLKNSLDNFLID